MVCQPGSYDEAMFDYIDGLPASPAPQSNVRLTPAGIRQLSRLDKTGMRLFMQIMYYNTTRSDPNQSLEVVDFFVSDSSDLMDENNNIVSSYQQRRRGIKNLVQNGFLKPHGGRKDAWRLNSDYVSLQRSVKLSNKIPAYTGEKPFPASRQASLFHLR